MKNKTQLKEVEEEEVNNYCNYGKCCMCGCSLPDGIAEGYCYDCEYDYEEY